MADNEKVLGEFQKSDTDYVQARESEFKGRQYFSFRVWFRPEGGEKDKRLPSKNGINLDFDHREAFCRLVAKVFPQYLTFKEPPVAAGSAPDA